MWHQGYGMAWGATIGNLEQRMGRGLYANRYFPHGTVLFKYSEADGTPTSLGMLVNPGYQPNVRLERRRDGCVYAVAMIPIYMGRQILRSA